LPIEPIARSSAEQRKGRCGRVSNGVCYRLYSEQDFLARPRFTTPEIHRSNLASVILRMMAFKLGDIRSFPFIDPPAENAIVGGYRLLAELGAVESHRENARTDGYRLTPLGRQLAHIPVDPTVGRMLLQGKDENVLDDVLVIAAGLSIQDPRERPAERAKEADAMHKQFTHPESDFLTLLNIWNAYHEKLDTLSQNKLRKFCKTHFLAYQRMREWRDIHHQLERVLSKEKTGRAQNHEGSTPDPQQPSEARRAKGGASRRVKGKAPRGSIQHPQRPSEARRAKGGASRTYAAIHRSILTGLLSNIAHKEEAHNYRGPRNRKALLFPGSALFDHEAIKKQRKAAYAKKSKPKPAKTKAPEWIVCGEWMETSRLFARTAARIEVAWIEELAADLIQIRHSEPFWSTKAAAALCRERRILFGLELSRHEVSYSRIDPAEATDIFIRNGLIESGIRERPPFLEHNAEILLGAESEMARRRIGSAFLVEDNLFAFYRQRLEGVGSYAELRAFAKKHHGGSLDFLRARESDLLPDASSDTTTDAFPRSLRLGGSEIPLHYRNERGSEEDGVTLRLPLAQVDVLQQSTLDWAVPGHLDEKIECLLRALPKQIRVQLHPLKERAAEIRSAIKPGDRPLTEQLAEHLRRQYGIDTYRNQWARADLPTHLKPRIQVENSRNEVLAQSRDLHELRRQLRQRTRQAAAGNGLHAVPAWQEAAARYEREQLQTWSFGDLPESIDLSGESGLPLHAYPALVSADRAVHLRLLPHRDAARHETARAWPDLAEQVMGREAAWVQRDLKALKSLGTALVQLGGYDAIKAPAWAQLRRHLFRCETQLPLRENNFNQTLQRAKEESRSIVRELVDNLRELLEARGAVLLLLEQKRTKQAITYPGMRAHLDSVAPPNLLTTYEFTDLPHLTRYLKGMQLRAQRARESIQRDIDKSQRIAPFENKLAQLEQLAAKIAPQSTFHRIKPYKMLLEEFKISIYAQELGTAQKVSEKRLDTLADSLTKRLTQFRNSG
ncbi:MAG: DUF3418 domain-containing protein, partial [Verrucomicrobia bacterium]|nr:DUF3418 domain-containing protein [Verrucomicrobiota bacterium]